MVRAVLCLCACVLMIQGVGSSRVNVKGRQRFQSIVETSDADHHSGALNATTDFDEGAAQEVKNLVTKVVDTAKEWIHQFRLEEHTELLKTCNKDAGECGNRGCSSSPDMDSVVDRGERQLTIKGEWRYKCKCICPEDKCAINHGSVRCATIVEVESLLRNGSVTAADLAPAVTEVGEFITAAGEFVTELPENLARGLAEHAFNYVIAFAENPLLMSEVLHLAHAAKQEICMATKIARHEARDTIVGSVTAWSSSVSAASASMKAGLEKGLAMAATMIVDVLKFIFSPAEAVPHIGIALKSMLHNLADWAGKYIHQRLSYWFATIVDEVLMQVSDMNHEVGETSSAIMSKILVIFKCPSSDSLNNWVKQLVESAQ